MLSALSVMRLCYRCAVFFPLYGLMGRAIFRLQELGHFGSWFIAIHTMSVVCMLVACKKFCTAAYRFVPARPLLLMEAQPVVLDLPEDMPHEMDPIPSLVEPVVQGSDCFATSLLHSGRESPLISIAISQDTGVVTPVTEQSAILLEIAETAAKKKCEVAPQESARFHGIRTSPGFLASEARQFLMAGGLGGRSDYRTFLEVYASEEDRPMFSFIVGPYGLESCPLDLTGKRYRESIEHVRSELLRTEALEADYGEFARISQIHPDPSRDAGDR